MLYEVITAQAGEIGGQGFAGGNDGGAALLEIGLVLDGGDRADDCQAIQRIGAEAVLDPLQCLDQVRVADRETDPQSGQRARLGQRMDDQQVVVLLRPRDGCLATEVA